MGVSEGVLFEITDKLGGYHTFKEFGYVGEVGNGMIIMVNFFV